jgi:hypothetical protein
VFGLIGAGVFALITCLFTGEAVFGDLADTGDLDKLLPLLGVTEGLEDGDPPR